MPDKKNAALLAFLLLLLAIYVFLKWRGEPAEFFELTAERVVMKGWSMEPAEYAGQKVTKITAASSSHLDLSLTPIGTSSENLELRNFAVYVPWVEGTARGVRAGWEGDEVPVEALRLLFPTENAEMEGVRMRFIALDAEEMVSPSMVVQASSASRPLQVSMPSVRMWGWSMEGPKEVEFSGRRVKVTEIRAERLSGEFYLGYGSCVLGGRLEQRGARIWAVETWGEAGGFRAGWRGDQAPQDRAIRNLVGDPATLLNASLKLLYLSADTTVLERVTMRSFSPASIP